MEDIIRTVIRIGFVVYLKQKSENRITIRKTKNITSDIRKGMFPGETGYVAVRLLKNAKLSNSVKNIAVKKISLKLDISLIFLKSAVISLSGVFLGFFLIIIQNLNSCISAFPYVSLKVIQK